MKFILLIILLTVACKQVIDESQIHTDNTSEIIASLETDYEMEVLVGSKIELTEIRNLENSLTEAINNHPHADNLRKMRHKVRSIIVLLHTGCFKEGNFGIGSQIDTESLCSPIVSKFKAMDYRIIDIEKVDEDFDYRAFLANATTPTTTDKQQLYRDLLEAIVRTNDASMEKYSSMWPFANINWFDVCRSVYRRQEGLMKSGISHCQQLKGHVPKALPFDQETKSYRTIQDFLISVGRYQTRLNKIRDQINQLLIDQKENTKDPSIKKQDLIPFLLRDVIHMTDLGNPDIIDLYENYYTTLIEAAQERLLPTLLHIHGHKLYLNPKGKWFGLKMPQHESLYLKWSDSPQDAIDSILRNLVSHYLRINDARNNKQPVKDADIFQWLIHNDIAAAQIILENPRHAWTISHLLHTQQHKFTTPKWLQNMKTWTHRLDILMIPVTILAAKFAPPFAPAVASAAIAINFFWIANATADSIVAFQRYQTIQRSLASGTSVNAKQAVNYAKDFKDSTKDAIVTVAVGGGLSLKALQLAAKTNKAKWATRADISAAVISGWAGGEGVNILGSFTDDTTYKEEHSKVD